MIRQALFVFTALASTSVLADAPSANTTYGPVVGKSLDSRVKAWLSVPFAKSPPGRFAPPVAPERWTEPKKTVDLPAACIQQINYPTQARDILIDIYSNPMPRESEDCLYLNVWAPSEPPPPEGYPVMFWLHGGNLQLGATAMPEYSGENMAKDRKMVVVTTNYRTNVFGFPNSFELEKTEHNLGFLDQRAALSWTQKNIASFGGDPKKVTIFGQSAGGYSVKQLLANPPEPLPFHAAIMQSQASGARGGTESWEKLADKLQCNPESRLACVKAAPATKIKDIIEREALIFGPREDEMTFTNDVRPNIASGKFAKVPILLGTNKDEGTSFAKIGLSTPGSDLASFFGTWVPGGPEVADFVLSQIRGTYTSDKYNTDYKLASAIFTDLGFTCSTSTLAKALVEGGHTVGRYYFAADSPQRQPFRDAGVWHGAEIGPIFGTSNASDTLIKRVGNSVQSAWTEFARNPTALSTDWPRLSKSDQKVKQFDIKTDSLIPAADIDSRCSIVGSFAEGAGV